MSRHRLLPPGPGRNAAIVAPRERSPTFRSALALLDAVVVIAIVMATAIVQIASFNRNRELPARIVCEKHFSRRCADTPIYP